MQLQYLHLDVFTDRLFGGNQLAVYLDPPRDLPTETMQSIAREMAFSETTFVFPLRAPGAPGAVDDPDFHVRIFTPANELPMAGHPTIGTAFALALAGRVPAGSPRMVFLEGVGPVPLDLTWQQDRLAFAWMTQPKPQFGPSIDAVNAFAAATSLDPGDLRPSQWPIQQVSCGLPYVIVPVASRSALDRARPEAGAHARAFEAAGLPQGHVYLFTLEPGPDGADVYTRMFAPDIGIPEDAATGSAAGPLGAYLVRHGLVDATRRIRNLQGARMGRPSWLHIEPVLATGTAPQSGTVPVSGTVPHIVAMRVGGESVLAGEGTLILAE
jgi:trans-2,3-dihydro-3-hydroxyanthranilate isomerase